MSNNPTAGFMMTARHRIIENYLIRHNKRQDDMTNPPIAVVTGANRGIGFEICRQLASRGAQVVLTARKGKAGEAAVKKLAAQNLTVQFRTLDVTSMKSIIALRDFLKQTHGRLDILINNAGIIAKGDAPGLTVDLEAIRVTLETNTLGPLHLSQILMPLLRRSKSARIVNLSSGILCWRSRFADPARV
jgi:NAD(P)-dependent dehydrogenase (short-subunit alcohol dehydrogenase family)